MFWVGIPYLWWMEFKKEQPTCIKLQLPNHPTIQLIEGVTLVGVNRYTRLPDRLKGPFCILFYKDLSYIYGLFLYYVRSPSHIIVREKGWGISFNAFGLRPELNYVRRRPDNNFVGPSQFSGPCKAGPDKARCPINHIKPGPPTIGVGLPAQSCLIRWGPNPTQLSVKTIRMQNILINSILRIFMV